MPAREQLALLFHLTDLPAQPHIDEQPPCSPHLLAEAYRHCQMLIRRHSKSFFFSTHFLPPAKREAIRALYAFCRVTDDTVDLARGDPARALAGWIQQVRAPHPPADDMVLLAWHDIRQRYALPSALIDELLAGVAMDLTIHRYASFAELWLYCYRVASVVGLLSSAITGAAPGARPYAIKLGVALQLTNILRDVGEDAARGRVYLPQDELAAHDLTSADISANVRDARFVALMRFQLARAHRLYDESWPGLALLPADSRLAVAAAALTYRAILDKIVLNNYDVYTRRASLSFGEKCAMLPKIWWEVMREK